MYRVAYTATGNVARYLEPQHWPLFYRVRDYRLVCPACANGYPAAHLQGAGVNYPEIQAVCEDCGHRIDCVEG